MIRQALMQVKRDNEHRQPSRESSIIPLSTSRKLRQIGRSDGDRVFRAAARHSRLVRFLRMAIPAGIVAIVSTIVVATFFNPFRMIPAFPIDPSKISLSGTKIVMELPRVNGFTTDSRPYELTARAATQDITKLEILELKDISAHVELKDGQRVTIKSINGVYDTRGELLKLNDHITLNSTSGYEGHLSEATVNVASGNIVSESPVEVKLPNGLLNANRLEVMENGALILFGGGVEMTLIPDQQRPAWQDAPSSAPAQVSVQHRPSQPPVTPRPSGPDRISRSSKSN
jgi:lipopolysaccharide export system protein LptC